MNVDIGPLADLPRSRSSPDAICEEVIETTRRAEDGGFDGVWIGERHFSPRTAIASDPFALAAGLARETETIRIGTAVSIAPLYRPVEVVERTALVDVLSGGRFTLGTGIGYFGREFEAFDVDERDRVPHLLDTVDLLEEAAGEGPVSLDGRRHSYEDLPIQPEFVQDPRPPVLLGGTIPQAIRRAARRADGYIGIPASVDFYESARANLEEGLEDRNRDYEAVTKVVLVNAFVAETTDEAWDAVRPGLRHLRERYAEWWGTEIPEGPIDPDENPAVVGTPDEVSEKLLEFVDVLGQQNLHLALKLHYPDVPRERSDRALELVSDRVLPELRR